MQLFGIVTKIHYFETFAEFAEEFSLTAEDLIFTEKIIYDGYIKDSNMPCHIMIRDDFEVGEPTEEAADKMLLSIKDLKYNRLIAIGGGSVMDTAKALSIKNAYPMEKLLTGQTPAVRDHELILIPTTCGTGSEISSGAVFLAKNGLKLAVPGNGAEHAALIPEFIKNLPFRIFFLSSMDALAHAVEGQLYAEEYVNPFGLAVARQAITMILSCQAELYKNGADYRQKLLKNFLAASSMGNMALTANGANMVHAMAYPPAEKFHMSHGESVYQFLIPVLNLYQDVCPDHPRFAALREMIDPILKSVGLETDGKNTFKQLEKMLNTVYPLRTMGEVGMTEDDIEPFSKNIVETKQRLLTKALISVDQDMVARMYRERL